MPVPGSWVETLPLLGPKLRLIWNSWFISFACMHPAEAVRVGGYQSYRVDHVHL